MSRQTPQSRDHAIVIGASIAGLLAARALSDYYRQVTLLERDTFPAPGANRKGVPQGRHTHVLLNRGRQVMEGLLPGLSQELIDLGAAAIDDVSANVRWFHSGAYHKPGVGGFSGVGVSRPTLEALIRRRVLALPNVRAAEGCNVLGLATTPGKERVTGVHVVRRLEGDKKETTRADLVVDAGGRGSRTPAWLRELGYAAPRQEEVRVGMGYVTCFFRRKPEHIPGLEGIVMMATPPDRRLAVLLAQDGNRWVLTIGGYLGDHVPADYGGFCEAASRLPTREIYEVIRNAEPLGDPVPYKFPSNARRHYEELSAFPRGYLVIGDALCSFNPIYGQGMTVAALEAAELAATLANNADAQAKPFFARAAKIVDASWSAAVGSDLGFPEIEGPRTAFVRFLNWYIGKLHLAAHDDAQVSIAFLKVINMIAPPPTILHPRIALRVAKARLFGRGSRQATPERQAAGTLSSSS